MPIGNYAIVSHISHDLACHRPRRILDLGVGSGFYGSVVRQWLDFGVTPWSTFLAGVEAWADYGNPMWDLYDLMIVDTIQNYLERHRDTFDCVLMTDVIEHFERQEGERILTDVKDRVEPGGRFLVATPGSFFPQGAVYGNTHETHRSCWSAGDFVELGFETLVNGNQPDQFGQQMILAVWENSSA